jgi:PAS domain S-box-containing protein
MKTLQILLIDDNPDDRILTIRQLKKEFDVNIKEIINQSDFNEAFDNFNFDVVITDYNLNWDSGLNILKKVKNKFPDCPVIMFTGTGNEDLAVQAMKAGLDDYVVKSIKHFIRLPVAVRMSIEHAKERLVRKQAETHLFESEEKFRNIFETSPNAISLTDLNGRIIECNQAMLELHGFSSKDEVIGKSTFDFIAPDDRQRGIENLKKTIKDGIIRNIEYTFMNKFGNEFQIELSSGVIMDLKGEPKSIVTMVKDITEEKRAQEEMKKRTMKYRLNDGKLYLAKENLPSLALDAFFDLLKVGYFGLIISRIPERDFKRIAIEGGFDFIWLAEKNGKNTIQPNLIDIETKIEKLPRKNVIMIDRIEYLISKNGFKNTLTFIQDLREISYLKGNIIILSFDTSILNNQELNFLGKECLEIQHRQTRKELKIKLFKILKIIYEENKMGVRPAYNNIGQKLQISKPTVRKRVRELIDGGLIQVTEKGRNKRLELTDTGRYLFFN